ncbi:Transcriptional regulatory protein RstA [Sodalis glossinidius str. 'morsitans']|uniref:Transcriptional regulatory protein RstA n=1 Tax=Sodalis glossinidius (strain morsitans) TaxID=343509 RepID=A0A193QK46_SODGM|nr:Transcriptional regulatory protein RstA [Sodalis glossinidius str. 'morsitans']
MNKIVYVEDDSEFGNLIAAWLGKHDFEVIVEPRGGRLSKRRRPIWYCWIFSCPAKTV